MQKISENSLLNYITQYDHAVKIPLTSYGFSQYQRILTLCYTDLHGYWPGLLTNREVRDFDSE